MKTNNSHLFVITGLLCFIGCGREKTLVPSPQPPAVAQTRKAELSRDEVLQRFQQRAIPEQIREFERLRAVTNAESQVRALELVLFRLTGEELFKIGITEAGGTREWAVASSSMAGEPMSAVSHALEAERISAVVNCDLGSCGWYVPREQFFRARKALLAATNRTGLGISVVEPLFSLE